MSRTLRPTYLCWLAMCLSLASLSASAWGPRGHSTVAEIAARRLDPVAAKEVQRLLATEPGLRHLSDISTWADDLRKTDPTEYRRTSRWHFVNIADNNCKYVPQKHCRRGDCVIDAIETQGKILGDRKRSDAERLRALKFVVHFVADVHQPLHVGYARDSGGNSVQINEAGRGTNLHRLWDSQILDSWGSRRYAQRLLSARDPPDASWNHAHPTIEWARESCEIVRRPGFYPTTASNDCRVNPQSGPPRKHQVCRKLDANYIKRWRPTAEDRLHVAGLRLAALLNRILGSASTTASIATPSTTPTTASTATSQPSAKMDSFFDRHRGWLLPTLLFVGMIVLGAIFKSRRRR